jgi:hypothetical protein
MQNPASLIAELLSNSIYQYVFAGLIAISIFPVLFKLLGKTYRAKRINSFEYRAFERFLSPAEHSFFFILKNAVSENYEIFAQVRIADVLYPKYPKFTRERQIALNKITSKHFDYLLCDKKTLSIVAAIELDDKSHQLESRKDRDYFLESACRSAGLKLIRFPCKSDYQLSTVREKIINEIKTEK